MCTPPDGQTPPNFGFRDRQGYPQFRGREGAINKDNTWTYCMLISIEYDWSLRQSSEMLVVVAPSEDDDGGAAAAAAGGAAAAGDAGLVTHDPSYVVEGEILKQLANAFRRTTEGERESDAFGDDQQFVYLSRLNLGSTMGGLRSWRKRILTAAWRTEHDTNLYRQPCSERPPTVEMYKKLLLKERLRQSSETAALELVNFIEDDAYTSTEANAGVYACLFYRTAQDSFLSSPRVSAQLSFWWKMKFRISDRGSARRPK